MGFTDSGTSTITVSFRYWDWFLEKISSFVPSGLEKYDDRLYILVNCGDSENEGDYNKLPKISLLFGGFYFEILPADYITNYELFLLFIVLHYHQGQ